MTEDAAEDFARASAAEFDRAEHDRTKETQIRALEEKEQLKKELAEMHAQITSERLVHARATAKLLDDKVKLRQVIAQAEEDLQRYRDKLTVRELPKAVSVVHERLEVHELERERSEAVAEVARLKQHLQTCNTRYYEAELHKQRGQLDAAHALLQDWVDARIAKAALGSSEMNCISRARALLKKET